MAKQKHIIPVRPGEKLELTIDNQGSSGDGICKYEGYTLFVPGGLPGDQVSIEVIKITKVLTKSRKVKVQSKVTQK